MATNAFSAAQFHRAISGAARQVPFALSLGLNNTGLDIQRAQLTHMHAIFEVRNRRFIGDPAQPHRGSIKRTKKATKSSPVLELAVLPPGGLARAGIITRHERDRERRPHQGSTLLVPVQARRTKTGRIRKRDDPKHMQFHIVSRGGGRARVWRGTVRTFMIRMHNGPGWIFRRVGKGSHGTFDGTSMLFTLEPRTPLTPELSFFENARREFALRFPDRFAEAYRRALETAR